MAALSPTFLHSFGFLLVILSSLPEISRRFDVVTHAKHRNEKRRDCQYLAFHEAHMGLQGRAFQANIFIVEMVFLADTRSAEELAVFTNMAPERLCLGCGLRVEEKFTPIFPGERGPLFTASVKLLQFALRASSVSAREKGLMRKKKLYYRPFGPW